MIQQKTSGSPGGSTQISDPGKIIQGHGPTEDTWVRGPVGWTPEVVVREGIWGGRPDGS